MAKKRRPLFTLPTDDPTLSVSERGFMELLRLMSDPKTTIAVLPPTGRVFVNGKWEGMASEWFGHDGKPMADPWVWWLGMDVVPPHATVTA